MIIKDSFHSLEDLYNSGEDISKYIWCDPLLLFIKKSPPPPPPSFIPTKPRLPHLPAPSMFMESPDLPIKEGVYHYSPIRDIEKLQFPGVHLYTKELKIKEITKGKSWVIIFNADEEYCPYRRRYTLIKEEGKKIRIIDYKNKTCLGMLTWNRLRNSFKVSHINPYHGRGFDRTRRTDLINALVQVDYLHFVKAEREKVRKGDYDYRSFYSR